MRVCVCVCVCERERGREGEREGGPEHELREQVVSAEARGETVVTRTTCILVCVCVYVCVCEREREREGGKERGREGLNTNHGSRL